MDKRGKYIVIEGAEGVGKTTISEMIVHELERLGIPARGMHEPDGKADPTTQEIRRLTQDPAYPMNTRTEVLLYNAARSQSLEAVRQARDSGEVVIVDRSYLTTLAVQFYGRGDIQDYRQLNDIITFAVGDMWPDLTIVLDAPVDVLQKRANDRGEKERFDNLDAPILERIRAGYLWEARQRTMPLVYATGRVDEVFEDVWRHIAATLNLHGEAVSEPTAVADLLAKSPAARVLEEKGQTQSVEPTSAYYVPATLPDDLQCDYCDDVEALLRKRRTLVDKLAQTFATDTTRYKNQQEAKKAALRILRHTLPVACASEETKQIVRDRPALGIDETVLNKLPSGFSSSTEPVRLVSAHPRNELDLLPAMLYESLDLPLNEVKATVETWPYEVKSNLFERYVREQPGGKALAAVRYEWDVLLALTTLTELPEIIRANTMLQQLTPRYGYDVPTEVEEAGLSDDYDDIFDQSLALHSTLQARGFADEAQYTTLLGHKQRWSLMTQPNDLRSTPKDSALTVHVLERLRESHPLLWGKLD